MKRGTTLAIAGVPLITSIAAGQIAYVSQERVVGAEGTVLVAGPDATFVDVGTTQQEFRTNALGEWEAFVDWGQDAFRPDGLLIGGFREQATQVSNLAADRITASGNVTSHPAGNQGSGRGISSVDVTFVIAEDVTYQLDMSVTENHYGSISLIGPGLDIVWDPRFEQPVSQSLSQSGVLSAGEYRLSINPWGEGGLPNATYYFSLIVPAPASAGLLGLGGLVAVRRRR